MTRVPDLLAQALVTGDCVLWAGAGFGTPVGRLGWAELLTRLSQHLDPEPRAEMLDLLEQGRTRTVLGYLHRHLGDDPLQDLLAEVAQASDDQPLPEALSVFAEIPWRALFATTYADVLYQVFAGAGRPLDVVSHTDVHGLTLRGAKEPFILRTPPTGRSMRADEVFFELVEEAVRTRTLLFLGFDIDDPDLFQIFELLGRVGRGRTHFAWMPFVTRAEAEEIRERYGIEVIRAEGEVDLAEAGRALLDASRRVTPAPSTVDVDLANLDLARALRGIHVRGDLAMDLALDLDVAEVERLVERIPGPWSGTDPGTVLRAGVVLLAHGRTAAARRCFQHVIARGAGREYQNVARFNLALAACDDGDRLAAVEGLSSAAEADRALALVPPRFEIQEVHGRDGTRVMFGCRDRESGESLDIAVTVLARPVSRSQQQAFYDEVQRLVELAPAGVKPVRGAFADGRLFGVMSEPRPGFVLADTLADEGPMPLDRAVEILAPVLEALGRCHAEGLLHRNVTPQQILLTPEGAILRGFGPPPIMGSHRPSVRRATFGFVAPEVLAGAEPTAASDVFAAGAVLYRCLTGHPAAGGLLPRAGEVVRLPARLDQALTDALSADPQRRPGAAALGALLRDVLARWEAGEEEPAEAPASAPAPAPPPAPAPAVPEPADPELTPPSGLQITPPEDPDDLESWVWILERKPTHVEAREALARIESQARDEGRWDRVADVLKARAQITQVQRERVDLLRELAGLLERELGAPAHALATIQALIEEVPVPAQVELVEDLDRLAETTGQYAPYAESLAIVAERVLDAPTKARLYGRLGQVYADQLGAPERAVAAFERAMELDAADPAWPRALLPLYRGEQRFAELVAAHLALADLLAGRDRAEHLQAAAELLERELEDTEGAFATLEALWSEGLLDDATGREHLLGLARAGERWDLVADLLEQVAGSELDDAKAAAALREVAQLARDHLDDPARARRALRGAIERDSEDREGAATLVELLRAAAEEEPALRVELIDALGALAERVGSGEEKAALFLECAALLDQEADGAERAEDARLQVLEAVAPQHALAERAVDELAARYERKEAFGALRDVLARRARVGERDAAARAADWRRVLAAARQGEDAEMIAEALEALTRLEPEATEWIDELLEHYMAVEDFERAGPLIRRRVDAEQDPARKVELLVTGARLRVRLGKTEGAIEALEEAVGLEPGSAEAWALLQELYEQVGKPLKALEAKVAAAQAAGTDLERTRLLFDAARACRDLDLPERETDLLSRVVELDPDHAEATERLLDLLVQAGELERAWPVARTFVLQARAQTPDDVPRNLRALSVAGRCALAVDERDAARDYLQRAKALGAHEPAVLRLLGDLEMDAGNWAEGLKSYQSVLMGAGESLEPAEQADLYVAMARARKEIGEIDKALPLIDRALDLAPDFEPAARMGVELAAEKDAATRARAARRLIDLRLRAASEEGSADPQARAAAREDAAAMLRALAELQAEEIGDPEAAIGTLEEVLALSPGDSSTLHAMLDLFTKTERWDDAVQVLGRLAEAQPDGVTRAKYLYAAAVLLRDNVGDSELAVQWLRRVLDEDPAHEKALAAAREILLAEGAYRDLARILRHQLKHRIEDLQPAERAALLRELGELYETRLDDPVTALAAYEQVTAALPSDDPQLPALRERVIELALALGGDEMDKAIAQAHALIAEDPMNFDLYHRLVSLYAETGAHGRAIGICRTLRFLKRATEHELDLASRGEGQLPRVREPLSRELWRACVYHRLEDPRLADLLAVIWPMVAVREGRTHAHLGLARDQRVPVTLQAPEPVARFLAYACQAFDVPVPDLFLREKDAGGLRVGALAEVDGGQVRAVYPTVIAGVDALAQQTDPAHAFRAGRAAAKVRPVHLLAAVLPSASGLRDAVLGAISLIHPQVDVPAESREAARAYGEAISAFLPPARRGAFEAAVARVVETGALDTRAFLTGAAYTVTRAGFLLSDSLETAGVILTHETDEPGGVPAKDRIKDLVAYSVSEPYFRAREALLGK